MAHIYCEPAECYEGCDDLQCPYTHWVSWHRVGDPQVYVTRADALAADNAAEDQASIRVGDELTNDMLRQKE